MELKKHALNSDIIHAVELEVSLGYLVRLQIMMMLDKSCIDMFL